MLLKICFGVLIACCLGAASTLPLLIWRDHGLAESRRRSVYSKCAGQGAALAFGLQIFLLVQFVLDSVFKGALITSLQSDAGRMLWNVGLLGLGLAALFSILYLLEWGGRIMALLSSLCALLPACISHVLLWHFLNVGSLTLKADFTTHTVGLAFALMFRRIQEIFDLPLLLFLLCFPFLAVAMAEGLALIWTLLRRNRDDFGRDYYTFALGYRARRAAYASVWLLPLAGVMLWLAPWPVNLPLAGLDPLTVTLSLNVSVLALPVAVYCWYRTFKSSAPLRCKSLLWLALPLMLLGVCGLMARLWVA